MAKNAMTPEQQSQFDMATEMLAKMPNLGEVARFIARVWAPVSPYAMPYLQAMAHANSFDANEPYIAEDQRTQVLYFICNAQSWKGPIAKATKSFLRTKYAIK